MLPPAQVNIRVWRRRFILAELFNGLALGVLCADRRARHAGRAERARILLARLHLRHAHRRAGPPHDVRGDDPGHPLRGHRADDDRGRGAPADPRQLVLLRPGDHGGRRPSLLPVPRPGPPIDGPVDARVPQREGRADRRAGGAEIRFRRSAPPRRGRQQRQVALPCHHEPRAAHPAQRHPRLLRSDEDGDVRPDGEPEVHRVRRQHPGERQASAAPHQRDPRPDAHRVGPLRVARGAGAARRYHR